MAKRTGATTEEQIFEIVRKSEEAVVEAGRTLAKSIASADGASLVDLVDDVFDFTERMLKSQRDFAQLMITRLTSPGREGPAPAAPMEAPAKPRTAKTRKTARTRTATPRKTAARKTSARATPAR